jgi:hypothetical protein
LERAEQPQTSAFVPRSFLNTNQYNFAYNQGFVTGTALNVAFNNSRVTSSNPFNVYSPQFDSNFRATVTQHLLQGAGIWVNKRFIYQALNDRRIADSSFRQQILYTVNQVENIYWGIGAGLRGCAGQAARSRPEHQAGLGRPQAIGDRHSGAAGRGQRRVQQWPQTSRP